MLAPKEMKARLTQVFSEPQATVLTRLYPNSAEGVEDNAKVV